MNGNCRIGFSVLAGAVVLAAAASVGADVVTERWGVSGHVQHAGALRYQVLGSAGTAMRFDLSALPQEARVYRARLFMFRQRPDYQRSFDIVPIERLDEDGQVKASGGPLELAGPYYRWFDVTEGVRRRLRAGRKDLLLLIRSAPRIERPATFLEIAYAGGLKDAPRQVTGMRAFCRSGQVFITFKEIEDLSEGQQRYAWGDLIKKLRGYAADGPIPKDDARELRYRVYRHDEPITAQTIGEAELLADVVPGSGFNTRMVRRIWQGENRPSKLDESFIAVRLGVEPGKPLPSGVGLHVHTVRRGGKGHYAVVTSVNGVENTADLSPANTAGPIQEKVAEPEPVLQAETVEEGRSPADKLITRRYCYWAVPPLSPRPLQYGLVVQYHPARIAKPAALEVSHGRGHSVEPDLSRWQRRDAILLALSEDPELTLWTGSNNCHGTLKSFRQGTWAPWPYRRQEKLVPWARKNWDIDDQQIYVYASHWGMWELRHPEIYAALIGWGMSDPTRGFQSWNRVNGVWGPPAAYEGKADPENPYAMFNYAGFVSSDPRRKLPYQILVSCTGSHTGEMGYPALPIYRRALMDAAQPFAACIGKASWGWRAPVILREFAAGRFKILRDQSKPAFANCTLDDNPGCGDIRSGDGVGLLNGYLLWETDSIVDEPGKWEMTVYLHASAPLGSCKVDLTPRHCQSFKARPGQRFSWTNTNSVDAEVVGRGHVAADNHGLVTLRRLTVTKGKNRIAISAAR